MTSIVISVLVVAAIVGTYFDVTMKLRVNSLLPPEEKFSCWNRNQWAVARKYQELFPNSLLPTMSRVIVLLVGAILLVLFLITISEGRW